MPSVVLTADRIDRLPSAPPGKRVNYFDTGKHGLVLRVTDRGARSFYFTYRDARGKYVWHLIAPCPSPCTGKALADARATALALWSARRDGGDPRQERADALRAAREAVTVAGLWEAFIEAKAGAIRASTATSYEMNWRRRVAPEFGGRVASTVTLAEVRRWHTKLAGEVSGRSANMASDLLRMLFNFGLAEQLLPDGTPNPAEAVRRYRETRRQRYLDAEGLGLLLAALDAEEAEYSPHPLPREGDATPGRGGRGLHECRGRGVLPQVAGLFRVLLLTGCRLSEVQLARWDWVDWSAAALDLPDDASKTGQRRVLLNTPAVQELARLRSLAEPLRTPWIVWSPSDPSSPVTYPRKAWTRVLRRAAAMDAEERAAAGLPPRPSPLDGLRIHDLRHSAASIAVSRGQSLPVIAGMLGHKSSATASRYAHLHNDPLREAVEDVGAAIAEAVAARGKVLEVEDIRPRAKATKAARAKG